MKQTYSALGTWTAVRDCVNVAFALGFDVAQVGNDSFFVGGRPRVFQLLQTKKENNKKMNYYMFDGRLSNMFKEKF